MESNNDEVLGYVYLSTEDFMLDRNKVMLDDYRPDFRPEEIDLYLNYKPNFDMAFILMHKNLYSKVTILQKHFQSNFGLITHCILLQYENKLKSLIKDLKTKEVLYAIVIDSKSIEDDEYQFYVLFPDLEVQKEFQLSEISALVADDIKNYRSVISQQIKVPGKNPHEEHMNDGFVPLSDEIRYFFCLLYDGRMLNLEELNKVKNYLLVRQKALKQNDKFLDPRCERPIEPIRQQTNKYSLYDPIKSIQPYTTEVSSTNVTSKSTTSSPIIQKQINDNKSNKIRPLQNPFISSRKQIQPIQSNLISPENTSTGCSFSGQNKYPAKKNLENQSNINNSSLKAQKIRFNLGNKKSDNDALSPLIYDTSPITPPSNDSEYKNSTIKRKHPSEKSPLSRSKVPTSVISQNSISSNLPLSNLPPPTPFTSIDLLNNDMDECDASLTVTSVQVMNLFKLVLELASLNLPDNIEISKIFCTACEKIKLKIPDENLRVVPIYVDSCSNQGFIEMINNIHTLCDSVSPNFALFGDLDYMWSTYFPSNVTDTNILIIFYKFIKLLIVFKAFNQFQDTMMFIADIINKIDLIMDYNFNMDIYKKMKVELNTLPRLFPLYYQQCSQFHKSTTFPYTGPDIKEPKEFDFVIKNAKIQFYTYSTFKYLFDVLNSISSKAKLEDIKVMYECVRTLRFCLRKMNGKIVCIPLLKPVEFGSDVMTIGIGKAALITDIKILVLELQRYRPLIFSEKHYEFLNCILDCALMIKSQIPKGACEGIYSTGTDSRLVDLKIDDFMNKFLNEKAAIILPYHSDTELEILRRKLHEHWKSLLYRAFRGSAYSEPNGSRMSAELEALLPPVWRQHTFNDAVQDAIQLYLSEWEKMARDDSKNSMLTFQQDRFVGLIWLNKHNLPMHKSLEVMSEAQYKIDQLFSELLCVPITQ